MRHARPRDDAGRCLAVRRSGFRHGPCGGRAASKIRRCRTLAPSTTASGIESKNWSRPRPSRARRVPAGCDQNHLALGWVDLLDKRAPADHFAAARIDRLDRAHPPMCRRNTIFLSFAPPAPTRPARIAWSLGPTRWTTWLSRLPSPLSGGHGPGPVSWARGGEETGRPIRIESAALPPDKAGIVCLGREIESAVGAHVVITTRVGRRPCVGGATLAGFASGVRRRRNLSTRFAGDVANCARRGKFFPAFRGKAGLGERQILCACRLPWRCDYWRRR